MKIRFAYSWLFVFAAALLLPRTGEAVILNSYDLDTFYMWSNHGGDPGEDWEHDLGATLGLADHDGDGVEELLMGAPLGEDNDRGWVYTNYTPYTYEQDNLRKGGKIFRGILDSGYVTGSADHLEMGTSIAGGDLNGDGYDEMIFGAPGYNPDGTIEDGALHIFEGPKTSSYALYPAVAGVSGTDERFGQTMVSGDLNGDGYDDLVVGDQADHIYVFYGDSSLTAGTWWQSTSEADAVFNGVSPASMAIGDVDGDGHDDVLIGSETLVHYDSSEPVTASAGAVYLILGDSYSGSYDTSVAGRFIIWGNSADDFLGSSVALADLDGDNALDLIIGAQGADSDILASSAEGAVYVVDNSEVSSATETIVDVASAVWYGENTGDLAGSEVATGDLNGDGLDDLLIGAIGYNTYGGSVYLIFSTSGSLAPYGYDNAVDIADYQFAQLDESNINAGSAILVTDADRDGNNDLIIGAKDQYNYLGFDDATPPGAVFAIYGPLVSSVRATSSSTLAVTYADEEEEDYEVFESAGASAAAFSAMGSKDDNMLLYPYPNSDKVIAVEPRGRKIALVDTGTGEVISTKQLRKKGKYDRITIKVGQVQKGKFAEIVVFGKKVNSKKVHVWNVQVRFADKANRKQGYKNRLHQNIELGKVRKAVLTGENVNLKKSQIKKGRIVLKNKKGNRVERYRLNADYELESY